MVAVSRDAIPVVKEYRAAIRAFHSEAGLMTSLELRTVITGLLALSVTIATPIMLWHGVVIPTGWWGAFASIWTFYFLDPKVLVQSAMQNFTREQPTNPRNPDTSQTGGIQ